MAATPSLTPNYSEERPYLYEPISPTLIPADIAWHWDSGQGGFREMTTGFTIHDDVTDWPGHYGYSLDMYNVISDVGFHFGLQTDGQGNRVIFQRQGTMDKADSRYSENDECDVYANVEYEYVEVECSYDWSPEEYRARIAPNGLEADGEWYGLWITDLSSDETTWIGSLKFPLEHGTTAVEPHSLMTIGSIPVGGRIVR